MPSCGLTKRSECVFAYHILRHAGAVVWPNETWGEALAEEFQLAMFQETIGAPMPLDADVWRGRRGECVVLTYLAAVRAARVWHHVHPVSSLCSEDCRSVRQLVQPPDVSLFQTHGYCNTVLVQVLVLTMPMYPHTTFALVQRPRRRQRRCWRGSNLATRVLSSTRARSFGE